MSDDGFRKVAVFLDQPVIAVVSDVERRGRLRKAEGLPFAAFDLPGGPSFQAGAVSKIERLELGHYQRQFDELRRLTPDDHGYSELRAVLLDALTNELGIDRKKADDAIQRFTR